MYAFMYCVLAKTTLFGSNQDKYFKHDELQQRHAYIAFFLQQPIKFFFFALEAI